ncbi:MAG: hydrogenase maturation nickel metallochaperone HypA [Nitratireductor sp.]|nr:hydrogenase maturation nickel metallochaperone HypA [Nitratireductor sp.]MCC0020982.1 hydrogenase maturation nickel metallochaperone HypA [Nitratireductor sp.]
MHEMAICESIRSALEEQAQVQDFSTVDVVRLEIGPLSGVEIEALKFGFDVVMRGSLAEKARLEIIETEAKAWCMMCAETVPIAQRFDPCPKCNSHQLQVTAGDEMRIKELEVN